MSEDPVGACCSIAIIACLDVCTGICIDFASIRMSRCPPARHGCTETIFRCQVCGRSEKGSGSTNEGERAPLIQQSQPAPSQPMVPDAR
ncbi:hypothetical protein BC826DRAFT_1034144 [Russula brevipes]|nr:hypothetical protein BC826DRAFT_1034144 [Russula brevipes]